MRALIVIRLSRVTEVTNSPELQLEICQELCRQRGYNVVGIAEDLDVSAGKTSPFERPALRQWIGDGKVDPGRSGEYEVIVFYRVDRIVRRLFDLSDLIRWSREHSVTLVSATEQHFDLSTQFGDIIALLVAKVAEMELAAISERNASAARHNIKAGRWRGGVPPWGYLPDDASGTWRLVQDGEQVGTIREVVRRVLDGEPLQRVAEDLTSRRVLTPKDSFAKAQRRDVKDFPWSSTQLKRSLISPAMLGHAVSNGASVRNDDGSPVIRAEPILTREVFERLAVELLNRSNRGEPTKRSTSLLLRVIYCGTCGEPFYRFNGGSHSQFPRYRCRSIQKRRSCGNRTVRLDTADEIVLRLVPTLLGKSERQERVWDMGTDHSVELADIDATLVDLASQLGTVAFRTGTPQRAALDERIANLSARQAELSERAVKPAGWMWKPTGGTFGDWWDRQDVEGRNIWLRSMNVRLDVTRDQLRLDLGDIHQLTEHMQPRGAVANWQQLFAAMRERGIQGMTIGSDGEIALTPVE
ncbi:recombinase family protein [Mycobacterium montefiorense]|uniref:Integrase n=1 Tax=Mycobacterium montefiorense TaxID=154654 RepID=A0AA37UTV9_9MYCO|nr:recombinase family protein [Mycobacterium montefiorense]GBG36845.1 integrase [Mycobacterium montefiorense]GKU37752.1 integrase [Mycobacterium montefiorense]GKU42710.1 integrase [Mycobacterium montefiorense]GKU46414.1 integrase [Mycobacterium montefiorense]GKU51003.1 integrase [Mycobacterium montefiorense]